MKATYRNLVALTAASARLPKAATRRALGAFFHHLAEAVWDQGGAKVPGLAAFEVRRRKERKLRNPVTGELMQLPRSLAVVARVSKHWRRRNVP